VLAFDIGGTYLRAALYDPNSDQVSSVRRRQSPNYLIHSDCSKLSERLMQVLVDLSAEVLAGRHATCISLAFPAPIGPNGTALAVPTLFGGSTSSGFHIASAATACWPAASVFVLNDLTAAGYRYTPELQDFCILTVGSGIGHKVFLGGNPQVGQGGRGGEIGHLRLDTHPAALPCDCGGRGHLGAIASGRGAVHLARQIACSDPKTFRHGFAGDLCGGDPCRLNAEILVRAFQNGDTWTTGVIRGTVQRLGQALAAIHLSVGVEMFIIIGGFAMALGERYRLMLAEGAYEACWDLGQDWTTMIRLGAADDDHALIGGGRFAARASALLSRS
jgi:glucokinase